MQRWLEAGTDKPGGKWVLEDRVVIFDWNREWAHLGSSSFTPTAQPDPARVRLDTSCRAWAGRGRERLFPETP
jgi:hypothetical protein